MHSGAGRPDVHLSGHLVHIYNVRPVVRVGVDTHTDQFPELQGKTVLLVLSAPQMVLPAPFK